MSWLCIQQVLLILKRRQRNISDWFLNLIAWGASLASKWVSVRKYICNSNLKDQRLILTRILVSTKTQCDSTQNVEKASRVSGSGLRRTTCKCRILVHSFNFGPCKKQLWGFQQWVQKARNWIPYKSELLEIVPLARCNLHNVNNVPKSARVAQQIQGVD